MRKSKILHCCCLHYRYVLYEGHQPLWTLVSYLSPMLNLLNEQMYFSSAVFSSHLFHVYLYTLPLCTKQGMMLAKVSTHFLNMNSASTKPGYVLVHSCGMCIEQKGVTVFYYSWKVETTSPSDIEENILCCFLHSDNGWDCLLDTGMGDWEAWALFSYFTTDWFMHLVSLHLGLRCCHLNLVAF